MGYVRRPSQLLGSLFQMDDLKAQDCALPFFPFFSPCDFSYGGLFVH